jgi:S1-C subfamily serine protease
MMKSIGRHHRRTGLLRSSACFIAPIAVALMVSAPVRPQEDAKRAKQSFIAIQRQIDSIESRIVKSTVALEVGDVSGSGVIISPDGYVLTAAHVIAGRSGRSCRVILSDGRRFQATVLGSNKEDDFGVIKIEAGKDLTTSPLGDSAALRPGEWVLATGHPLGLHAGRPPVLRIGRVLVGPRRRSGQEPKRILTDAPLISGDSGGPLFDLSGRVVGINSMITEGNRWLASIHIPANLPKAVLTQLETGEDPTSDDVQNAPITRKLREAESALQSGDSAVAVRAASEGARLDPTSAAVHILLARANARAGKNVASLAALQQACDLGFVDGDYLREETDFTKLRTQAAFQGILSRLEPLSGIPGSRKGDRPTLAAAADIEPGLGRGVVGVFAGETQVALGTIMSADGDILTKASELPEGPITCRLASGQKVPATRRGVESTWDVALLKISASGLPMLTPGTQPAAGHWTFSPDGTGSVAALGMVGVAEMPVFGSGIAPKATSKAYMGVRLIPVTTDVLRERGLTTGVAVAVEADTPAARAGIQTGDVIFEVDGKPVQDPDQFMDLLVNKKPGDSLNLRYARGMEKQSISLNLTTRPSGLPGRGGLAEMLSGDVSRKAGPFPQVIHHDAVLSPKTMGGPVIDSDGNLIGLNIARADRTSTYAIQAKDLGSIYAKLKAKP